MRLRTTLLLCALAVAYQVLAARLYEFSGVRPDFVFIALLYLAFYTPTASVLLLAGSLSFVLDGLSLSPAGTHAISLLPVLWLASRTRGWFVLEIGLARGFLVLPATLLYLQLQRVYLVLGPEATSSSSFDLLPALSIADVLFLIDLKVSIYTTLAALVIHAILDHFRPHLLRSHGRFRPGWR